MNDAERYAIATCKVVVDGEELWRATVREFPDLAEFADTREEAIDLAMDAIETLKKAAEDEGGEFPEPFEDEEEYSGRVTLRMSKSMHRVTAERAEREGVSLNSYIVECIAAGPTRGAAQQVSSTADFTLEDLYTTSPYVNLCTTPVGSTVSGSIAGRICKSVFRTYGVSFKPTVGNPEPVFGAYGDKAIYMIAARSAEETPGIALMPMLQRKRAAHE